MNTIRLMIQEILTVSIGKKFLKMTLNLYTQLKLNEPRLSIILVELNSNLIRLRVYMPNTIINNQLKIILNKTSLIFNPSYLRSSVELIRVMNL